MAFGCKDPSVTYLNRYGYNVVKLPRAGINPLQVLGRDKGLHLIGDLAAVWKTPSPPPQPGAPRRAVNVEGQKTDQLDLSIGLTMLANALAAFGATMPSLEFAYHRAHKVQFTLTNVSAVGIDPFEVGEFLATGDLNLRNPVAAEYFDRDDSSAYIITEVLMSDSITVAATDSRNVGVTVDVPAIASVLGTKVGVKPSSDGSSSLTYSGPTPVTFGFKAFEIEYAGGRWRIQGVEASAAVAFETGQLPSVPGVIFNPGGVIRL